MRAELREANWQEYNDICKTWNYQLLLPFFGADTPSRTFTAKTKTELDFLLDDKVFNKADVIQVSFLFCTRFELQVVEVFMDKYDYPWRLSAQIELITKNKKKLEEEKAKKKQQQNGV